MALEQFVDTITASISLRVKVEPVSPLIAYFSSSSFNLYKFYTQNLNYITNNSTTYPKAKIQKFIPFLHAYNNVNHITFTGTPNVLNLLSIYIHDGNTSDISVYPLYTFLNSYTYLQYEKTFTNNQSFNVAHNVYPSESNINVGSASDIYNFDYNKNLNSISVEEISFEDASNSDPNNDNNDNNNLKEFWA
jgi:hypothetical protein